MKKKILYFGYGANSRPEMMEAITGNKSLVNYPAVLKNYQLCIQRLDQIPETVFELLRESWGEKFTTYTIKSKERSEVEGTIWELTPFERELVRDWELIDRGWYKDIKAKAITSSGQEVEVETEGLRKGQAIDREVNGRNYSPFLNDLEKFQKLAEKSRKEYFTKAAP